MKKQTFTKIIRRGAGCAWRLIFGAKVSAVVVGLAVVAMWWHNITIPDIAAANDAVTRDCLAAMPWIAVWTARAIITDFKPATKGGEV